MGIHGIPAVHWALQWFYYVFLLLFVVFDCMCYVKLDMIICYHLFNTKSQISMMEAVLYDEKWPGQFLNSLNKKNTVKNVRCDEWWQWCYIMTYSAHGRQSVQLLSASISNDIHHTGLPLYEPGEMKISLDFFDSKMQIEHKLFIIILSDVKLNTSK